MMILSISLSGCLKEKVVNRPVDQPFTKWVSEDHRIYFETDAGGAGFGTLTTDSGDINIYFATGAGRRIDIYAITQDGKHVLIESWYGKFKKPNVFTARVLDTTTYYEEGDKIKVFRIEE